MGTEHPTMQSIDEKLICLLERAVQSTVTYHCLRRDVSKIPVSGELWYSNDDDDKHMRRLLRKGRLSFSKIRSLLSLIKPFDQAPTPYPHGGLGRTLVSCNRSAIIAQSSSNTSPHRSIAHSFTEIRLAFQNGHQSTQFLSCRASDIKQNDLQNPHIRDFLTVSTGMCLFSSALLESLQTMHGSNQPPPEDLSHLSLQNATLYEVETMTRLSSTIANIIMMAIDRDVMSLSGCCVEVPIHVQVDIPSLQYYSTAIELLAAKKVDFSFICHWIQLVDRRHDQIGHAFCDTIKEQLQLRGIGDELSKIKITLTSAASAATTFIRDSIKNGVLPTTSEALTVLQSKGEHAYLWHEFLSQLDESQMPASLKDLAHLTYVFEVLHPILPSVARNQKRPRLKVSSNHTGLIHDNLRNTSRPVVIFINDISEWKIFDRAEKLLKAKRKRKLEECSPKSVLVGIFPFHQIVPVQSSGLSSLFFYAHDQIFKAKGERAGDTGLLDPIELVERTYKSNAAPIMYNTLKKHGLWES